MSSPEEVVLAVRAIRRGAANEAEFRTLADYGKKEFGKLQSDPDPRPGFAGLVARMDPGDVVSLLVNTNSLGVWIDRAGGMKAAEPTNDPSVARDRRERGAAAWEGVNAAFEAAVRKVAECWPKDDSPFLNVRRDNTLRAMGALLNHAEALSLGQAGLADLRCDFATMIYPAGMRKESAAVADASVIRIYAAQIASPSVEPAPFAAGLQAQDFLAELARRRPAIEDAAILAMGEAAAARAEGAVEGNSMGLRVHRDNHGRVSRDPFEGAALEHDAPRQDGRKRFFMWAGERLSNGRGQTSLADALETFRSDFPADYARCAEAFVNRCKANGIDPESLPPALRAVLVEGANTVLAA